MGGKEKNGSDSTCSAPIITHTRIHSQQETYTHIFTHHLRSTYIQIQINALTHIYMHPHIRHTQMQIQIRREITAGIVQLANSRNYFHLNSSSSSL